MSWPFRPVLSNSRASWEVSFNHSVLSSLSGVSNVMAWWQRGSHSCTYWMTLLSAEEFWLAWSTHPRGKTSDINNDIRTGWFPNEIGMFRWVRLINEHLKLQKHCNTISSCWYKNGKSQISAFAQRKTISCWYSASVNELTFGKALVLETTALR